MTNENLRVFPDILAVDPSGCGCTECSIGEYVNEDAWAEKANAYDVAAILNGDVKNNTHNSTFDLVMGTYFSDYEVREFVRKLKEKIERDFDDIDLEDMLP
jgi:hypothetical protein